MTFFILTTGFDIDLHFIIAPPNNLILPHKHHQESISNNQSIRRAQFKFGFIFFKAMWEHFPFSKLKLVIAQHLDTQRGNSNSQCF